MITMTSTPIAARQARRCPRRRPPLSLSSSSPAPAVTAVAASVAETGAKRMTTCGVCSPRNACTRDKSPKSPVSAPSNRGERSR